MIDIDAKVQAASRLHNDAMIAVYLAELLKLIKQFMSGETWPIMSANEWATYYDLKRGEEWQKCAEYLHGLASERFARGEEFLRQMRPLHDFLFERLYTIPVLRVEDESKLPDIPIAS